MKGILHLAALASGALALLAGCAAPTAMEAGTGGKIEVQWLGNAAMKITTVNGKVILIDPYLTNNPKTPAEYKNFDALGKIDIILVTHGHGDHLGTNGKDYDAVLLSKKHDAPLWGPAGLNQSLITLGVLSDKLSLRFGKGGTITPFPGVRITATHAEHSSEIMWMNPATGKGESHLGGEPVGFIIELENGFRIYHMGDSGIFGDMKLIGDYYKPDLVMIPIGGHFVMDPKDAAMVTNQFLKPRFAIPMHYGTNPMLKGTPEEYIQALGNTSTKIFAINPGEKLNF
jgi:L-ascorbate metabolism protein UlaG (beta-lactamase superfamily)